MMVERNCLLALALWAAPGASAFGSGWAPTTRTSMVLLPCRLRETLSHRTTITTSSSRLFSATLNPPTTSNNNIESSNHHHEHNNSNNSPDQNPKIMVQKKQKSNNSAMGDISFLRKRTMNLLRDTAPGGNHQQLHQPPPQPPQPTVVVVVQEDYDESASPSNGRGMKVHKKTFHFLIDAWAFSGELEAADQALALLSRMEELARSDQFKVTPDVRSYTKVINAVSRSTLPNAGDIADSILQKMDKLYRSGKNQSAKPNTFTYTAAIEAYANSGIEGAAYKAEALLEKAIEKYEGGDPDVRPNARCFNAVITAFSKSGDPMAAHQAEQLFHKMEELYHGGVTDARPNFFIFNSLISAWANCAEEGSGERAEEVLARMERQFKAGNEGCRPTTVSYNCVIDAYAKSSNNEEEGGASASAMRAEGVLRRMEERYKATGDDSVKPNARSFNAVLNAWAKSRAEESAFKAEELLDEMTKLAEEGNDAVRPDVHSFCTVINAWARSNKKGKAERANNLFREMTKLYEDGNPNLKPNVIAVNAVMNACAYTTGGELVEQGRAMEIAHQRLRELEKSPFGSPDQVTYGTFLKVCANQMSDCSTRQQLTEVLFKKCKKDGQVGNLVIQEMKALGPDDLYQRLMGRHMDEDITSDDLPAEWTKNVVEGKWRRRRNHS